MSIKDYSPFGVQLSGRNFIASGAKEYRMGFQGQEEDDEIKGDGNSYDFGARFYDSRLGRWLSIDAMVGKYPSMSPYNFGGNNPICFKDVGGDSIYLVINGVAINITNKKAYKSDEIKKIAYYTLKATAEGKRLLDKHKNSSDTHIYIAIGDIADDNPNDGSTAQAETFQQTGTLTTTYSDGTTTTTTTEDLPKGFDLNSTGDFDIFAGVKTQAAGSAYQIVINKDMIAGTGEFANNKHDRFRIAAVLYHEMRAHIEMANAVNAEVEKQYNAIPAEKRTANTRQELTTKISHEKYGSYGSTANSNEPNIFTDPSGPVRWSKPAWTICKQLEHLKNK